jgi:hypothetical protein
MAFQMVYTSVRSGLVAGRSGFCTAARHREIKESLVARLEDFSAQYDRGIAAGGTLPVVYQHRIVTIRDQRHHVLMRLGDAGNDYTGRTNHIAHCLVVEPSEIAGLSISPAEAILVLSQRGFWRNQYDEPAQFFGAGDLIDLGTFPRIASLPAARWRERTGSSANAAQLFDSGGPADAGIALAGTGEAEAAGILALFAESLLLVDPGRSSGTALWSVPFTTVLQSSAERSQFRWCGIVADSGPAAQEGRAGRRILTLGSSLNPPSSAFADIAEGRAPRLEPAAAVVAMGTAPAGATDPREPALGSNPSAGAVPERLGYAVPLSLEDPRRAERSAKSRKNPARTVLICAAAVVLLLAAAGMFMFWHGNKEVWEEERRIGEMVEKGDWKEISRQFPEEMAGPLVGSFVGELEETADFLGGFKGVDNRILKRSAKLGTWKNAATAINSYEKLKTNPQNYEEDFKTLTINEALIQIEEKEPKGDAVDSKTAERIKKEKAEAENSVEFWNRTIDTIAPHFKSVSALTESQNSAKTTQIRNELAKTISEIEESKLSPEAEDQLKGPLLFLEDHILKAIDDYSTIGFIHESEEKFKDAKVRAEKISEGLNVAIKDLQSKQPPESKELGGIYDEAINAYKAILKYEEKIKVKPTSFAPKKIEPPKPDPAVTAAAEAKKDKIPPKTILINAGTAGDIDFSTIEGAPPTLPGTFEIFPLSSLVSIDGIKGQISTRKGNKDSYNYYDKDKVILRNPGELKLKKELEAEFWKPFRGGFILCLPRGGEGHDDVRYVVLDTIPVDQVSTSSPPFIMVPCSSFLKRLASGEVAAADDVMRILARTELAGEGSLKYRLTLRREFPLASGWVEDPSQIKLPLATKVDYELSRVKDQKAQRDDLNDFESSYAKLGEALFPQFFEPNPGPGEKVIVDKKNPGARKDSPKVIKTFAEFVDKESVNHLDRFTKYVAGLFNQLNELAGDDSRHASANADFQRLIKSPRDLKAEGILTPEAVGWIEVTKLSKDKNNNWGDSTATSASVSLAQTKANEDQIRNEFQKKYFNDFFRVWNERFSEEAVKKIVEVLKLIESTQALPSLEQLDSKLKALEATKSRLENNDLTDDGEYTLELKLETPNSPSPQIIPLIRGTR